MCLVIKTIASTFASYQWRGVSWLLQLLIVFLGADLWLNFLPHSSKSSWSVDVLSVDHLRNVWEDEWLAMDEPIQEVFLKGR